MLRVLHVHSDAIVQLAAMTLSGSLVVLADPVVACDGHSYEREAILLVLSNGNGLSPLTREPLRGDVFPNRNLKRRIEDHDEELLRVAATAVATAISSSSAIEQAGASSGDELRQSRRPTRASSSGSAVERPPAKRSRR